MRGRKPKPIERQIAEGDTRKVGAGKLRQRLSVQPKAACGLPPCPRHLKGRARAAYLFWSDELEGMGLDKRPDAMMLEGACVGYARAVQADLILERDGVTVEDSIIDKESGERIVLKVRKHPAVEISNSSWRQVRAFASEFGLSPVSRIRLAIEKKDEGVDDLAALLTAPRPQRTTTTVN